MRSVRTLAALLLAASAFLAAACSAGSGPRAPSAFSEETASVKQPEANRRPEASTAQRPSAERPSAERPSAQPSSAQPSSARVETATFGAGCFWCVEAVFERLPGVLDVRSGYMGGTTEKPTYAEVCEGDTGHAEVVQISFDPARISFETLLEWFWKSHDPTTLNRQGADVGTQYRSAVFVHSDAQRAAAEASRAAAQSRFRSPIVTEIAAAGPFTEAEDYHQDYFRLNGTYPYCRAVIAPKIEKLGLGEPGSPK